MVRHFFGSIAAVVVYIICWCTVCAQAAEPTPPAEHPLAPVLKQLTAMKAKADKELLDYTCTITTRERFDGKYEDRQFEAKIRHKPQAIYAKYLKPSAGALEIIYDADVNEDRLLVARTDANGKRIVEKPRVSGAGPHGGPTRIASTDTGIHQLLERICDVLENDSQYGNCAVRQLHNVEANGVTATCIEVVHAKFSRTFVFHKALVYIDTKASIPVRFEAYDWPDKEGDEPALIERCDFTNVKPNVKLTAEDFSPQNPNYRFRAE